MKKNSKKKGFTLIELIAVIAILGILAAILVPNIIGYTSKARKAKVVADAKIIVNAVSAYNSDADTTAPIDENLNVKTELTKHSTIVGSDGAVKVIPGSVAGLKISDCRGIADGTIKYGSGAGEFTVDSAGIATVK